MIAKIVVYADRREETARSLALATSFVRCWPVKTNASFLVNALQDGDFISGNIDTGLIPRKLDSLVPSATPSATALQSVAHMIVDKLKGGQPEDIRETYLGRQKQVWTELDGFRVNGEATATVLRLTDGRNVFEVTFDEISMDASRWVERVDDGYLVDDLGSTFVLREAATTGAASASEADGAITSPMPGRVIAVDVRQGDSVKAGQKLLTLEAMKMEHSLAAPFDGIVAELHASEGGQVTEGTMLVRIEPAD
jgi:3-methylcrotonyl-CoA carboxylase alpha subunit